MTSFEGNTGPFLQYSHARLCSIQEKAKERENLEVTISVPFDKLLKVKNFSHQKNYVKKKF